MKNITFKKANLKDPKFIKRINAMKEYHKHLDKSKVIDLDRLNIQIKV